MKSSPDKAKVIAAAIALLLGFLLAALSLRAQVSAPGEKSMGTPNNSLPAVLNKVTITQRLNQMLPLAAPFKDETGAEVHLGDYFSKKKPAILALVYFQCPMLCSEELNGLSGALQMVNLKPGKDFDIIVLSIDPSEGPELAAAKKRSYVKRYGHPESAPGWHFLTGKEPDIEAVARSTGFGYLKIAGPDGKLNQYAHASAIQIVTPEGRIAQYYLGVEYSPKDLRIGLVEASGNRIGTPVDNILTYCYHYDPKINRHSLIVARVVQLGGGLTVLALGSFMLIMFRRDRKNSVQIGTKKNG